MPEFRHIWVSGLVLALVVGGIVTTAVLLVAAKHETRQLFVQLERLNEERDQLQIEWGKLKLEQSTWATHGRVEDLARGELGMVIPATEEAVLVAEGTGN